jgi:hypothetical protein
MICGSCYLPGATHGNSYKAPSFFQGGGWGMVLFPGCGIRIRKQKEQEKLCSFYNGF